MISYTRASFTTIHQALTRTELATTSDACYYPIHGKLTAFFLYTGVIMLLQRPLGQFAMFQWMARNVPTPRLSKLLYSYLFICQSATGITEIGWLDAISVTLRWVCGTFESCDVMSNFQWTVQGSTNNKGASLQIKNTV
jgi:hypothetical protein